MTLKNYLLAMILTTLLCWGIFGLVISTVDPFATNWVGFTLFYVSLFLALSGTSAIIGFLVRFALLRQELAFRLVANAFRQSFLVAFLIVAGLALLAHNLLSWLNLALLLAGVSFLEFFLLSYGRARVVKDLKNEENITINKTI